MAPLKLSAARGATSGIQFPRARARGPIEAKTTCDRVVRAPVHFHERALVAPLKLVDSVLAHGDSDNFHERALVAPLKRGQRQPHPLDGRISTSARSWPH